MVLEPRTLSWCLVQVSLSAAFSVICLVLRVFRPKLISRRLGASRLIYEEREYKTKVLVEEKCRFVASGASGFEVPKKIKSHL